MIIRQNVPHFILRTSNNLSSTILLLVIDNVVSSDSGVYQCTARDGLDTIAGNALSIEGKTIITHTIFDGVPKCHHMYSTILLIQ